MRGMSRRGKSFRLGRTTINLRMFMKDKERINQTAIHLEYHSMSEFVMDMVRRGSGYKVVEEVFFEVEVEDLPPLPVFVEELPEDVRESYTILSLLVKREEFDKIREIALKNRCKGVPSYILSLLVKNGVMEAV